VANLDVVLTSAVLDKNNACRVMWEPQGLHQDQLICATLNRWNMSFAKFSAKTVSRFL